MDELNQLAQNHPYRYTYEDGLYYRQRYCGGSLKILGCLEVFAAGAWQTVIDPTPMQKAA